MNPSLNAPNYPPSLPYPSLHFTTPLDNLNTFTFPSVHHTVHYLPPKRREARVHRHGVTYQKTNFEQRCCESSNNIVNWIMMYFLRLMYDVSANL